MTEVRRLRAEIEQYRQRELDSLREQLAAMTTERDHYREEAHRLNMVATQIHQEAEKEKSELVQKLQSVDRTNARPTLDQLRNRN